MEPPRNAPPMPPQHPPHVLEKMERRRKLRKTALFIAPVIALVLALGIWIGRNSDTADPTEPPPPVTTTPKAAKHPETTVPPKMTTPPDTTVPPAPWIGNTMRSDEIVWEESVDYTPSEAAEYVEAHSVFNSEYRREQISSVTFLSTLANAPETAWDVSRTGNGSVLAWVKPDGKLYHLFIAGEGGVMAPTSCEEMFAGYCNVRQFSFGDVFHTDATTDMYNMFRDCRSVTVLDLTGFDTTNVRDMRGMFSDCVSLNDLNLSSFNTQSAVNMSTMFYRCESLSSLDLSNFDTSRVIDMSFMFLFCSDLRTLDLTGFDTSKASTESMFDDCPAGADWQHLLNN